MYLDDELFPDKYRYPEPRTNLELERLLPRRSENDYTDYDRVKNFIDRTSSTRPSSTRAANVYLAMFSSVSVLRLAAFVRARGRRPSTPKIGEPSSLPSTPKMTMLRFDHAYYPSGSASTTST